MLGRTKISTREWDQVLNYLALIIECYGDQFWPLFEVLEAEYEYTLEQKRKLRSRVAKFKPSLKSKSSTSKARIHESA